MDADLQCSWHGGTGGLGTASVPGAQVGRLGNASMPKARDVSLHIGETGSLGNVSMPGAGIGRLGYASMPEARAINLRSACIPKAMWGHQGHFLGRLCSSCELVA